MTDETVILETGTIKITNVRAVFGSKTYAVSNITSVDAKAISPSGCAPIALIVIGAGFGISAAFRASTTDSWWVTLLIGVAFMALGFRTAAKAVEDYSVNLTTAGGEVTAYQSKDKAEIQKIVAALNEAMIKNG
jgi:hypothetical protein